MSIDALSLKYRPKKLVDVIGQPIVVQTLMNSWNDKNWHHAYLLDGNLGSGKTTICRIMAAMDNCEKGPTLEPCGICKNCTDIFAGKSIDVCELDAASNRGIDDIRELRSKSYLSPVNSRVKYFILDECLGHATLIDTEIGKINISKIVNKKLNIKVKSYNEETKKIEYRPITGWFKNKGKCVYNMAFSSLGHIYPTENHLISTPSGYKKVKDLKVGDKVYRFGKILSPYQLQFIYGSLLGDTSMGKNKTIGKIVKNKSKPRLKFIHGEKQKDYLLFKKEIMKGFIRSNEQNEIHRYGKTHTKDISTWRINTLTSNSFINIYENVYKNGKRKVTKKWLEKVDWCGIAFWFMDDGSCTEVKTKKKKSYSVFVSFSTHSFSKKECIFIKNWLKNKGIKCYLTLDKRCDKYFLQLRGDSSIELLRNISKYIPGCMRYKLKCDEKYNWEKFDASLVAYEKEGLIEQDIIYKKIIRYEPYTYDLEVENNHNYFAKGTLVHNCHSLTGIAAEAALKFIEEPPNNVRILLATTDPQKMKDTIISRCIRLSFNKISWMDLQKHLQNVCSLEKIECNDNVSAFIAKTAKGSARDALQNLQNVSSFAGKNKITLEDAQKVLGFADVQLYFDLIDNIVKIDSISSTLTIEKIITQGKNVENVIEILSEHLRNLLLARTCGNNIIEFGILEDEAKRYIHQASSVSPSVISQMLADLMDVQRAIVLNLNPQFYLEKWVIQSIISVVKSQKK